MTKDEVLRFFSDRPAINIRQFEKECGWNSDGVLSKYLNGTKSITANFVKKILPIMVKYGFEVKSIEDKL